MSHTPNQTMFCLYKDESCEWDDCPETRCAQAEDPRGLGFMFNGHRIWRAPPTKACVDAHGRRADMGPMEFRRFSAPPGPAGTPPGFEEPDGFNHLLLSPYVRYDEQEEQWDHWPIDDPTQVPNVGPTCGYIVEGGGRPERAFMYCTARGGYPTIDPIDVLIRRDGSGRAMFIHTSQVAGNGICLVTQFNHMCGGQRPSTGAPFIDGLFDYVGVDLSSAGFLAGPFDASSEIVAIKNAALAKVAELTGDNMDRIGHFYDSPGAYFAHKQDWWERTWPGATFPAHANEWPHVRTVTCRLRESGKEFPVHLVMTGCRMWLSLQILTLATEAAPEEVRPSIVFGVDFNLECRLDLGASWPGFALPAKITRNWLDPGDPNYEEEVTTSWVQDGTSGQSMSPGLRHGGAEAWSLAGERMTFVGADGKTFFPPLDFGWRAELGQDTDPVWPDWYGATVTHPNAQRCCGIVCSMRPLLVPARRARRVGEDAPELWDGSVALTMAAHYSDEVLEGICGC